MSVPRFAMAVALSLVLGACRSSGEPLAAPADFRVERWGVFTQIVLGWTPVSGVDGYELEGRVVGDAWESLLDPGELLPADVVGVYLSLPDDLPELLALEFRIRSARGADRSSWIVGAFDTGIRWPEAMRARATPVPDGFGRFTDPVTVTWENRSSIAFRVLMERAPTGTPPDSPAWEPLPVTSPVSGVNSFIDDTVWDGTSFLYRIRLGAKGWSAPAYADSELVDVVTPRDLAAVPEPGGVRVSWTHRGRFSPLVLSRGAPGGVDAEPIPVLPAGSGDYLDPLPSFWPGLNYRLSATGPEPWYARVWTDPVVLATVDVAEPLALRGVYVHLDEPGAVAATPDGLLHLAPDGSFGTPPRALRDTGAGWDAEPLVSFHQFVWPGVRADGAGHPHWVHLRSGAPGLTLVHVWWDGVWRREDLAAASESGASFDVSPAGTLHVVYQTRWAPPEVPTWDVVYLAGAPGSYAQDVLATNGGTGPLVSAGRVTVAADGTGYVLLDRRQGYEEQAILATRAPSGAVAQEEVPFADRTNPGMLLGAGNGGAVAVVQRRYLLDLGRHGMFLLRRIGGAWLPEEEIEDFDANYLQETGLSADGARLFLAVNMLYPHHLELRLRTETGWHSGWVGPSVPSRARGGFWPDGRLHLEVVHSWGPGATDGARYAEPAPP